MTDEENAALMIKTGVEQLMRPLQDLVEKLLGPAATDIGLSLGDSTKVWRFKRQLRLLKEVQRQLDESGLKINPVATRLFFPVLEAASIEDDDDMQTRWAALLANEATNVGSVHPSFVEILKQMAPDDARLLDKLYDACKLNRTRRVTPWVNFQMTYAECERRQAAGENPEPAFNNLIRLGLIQPNYKVLDRPKGLKIVAGQPQLIGSAELKEEYELSEVAFKFVEACRAPKLVTPNVSSSV